MSTRQRGHRHETTPERIATFLEVLASVGLLQDACVAAGLDRSWIWQLRQLSPCFAEKVEKAILQARTEGLIVESLRRGAMGMDEEIVVYEGQVVMAWYDENGHLFGSKLPARMTKKAALDEGWQYRPLVKRSRDTRAATFLLAAMDPERYGRTRMELTGKDGGPVETRNVLVVPNPQEVTEWGDGQVIEETEAKGEDA